MDFNKCVIKRKTFEINIQDGLLLFIKVRNLVGIIIDYIKLMMDERIFNEEYYKVSDQIIIKKHFNNINPGSVIGFRSNQLIYGCSYEMKKYSENIEGKEYTFDVMNNSWDSEELAIVTDGIGTYEELKNNVYETFRNEGY